MQTRSRAHAVSLVFSRHEQSWGFGASRTGIQDAMSPGLPHLAPWADAAMLEKKCRGATHLWVFASLPGGLFHSHWASVPAWGQPLNRGPANLGPSQLGLIGIYSFLISDSAFSISPWPWNPSLGLYHTPNSWTVKFNNSKIGWMDVLQGGLYIEINSM